MEEKTFSLLKPDIIKRNLIGKVLKDIEEAGFVIEEIQSVLFTKEKVEKFYGEHREKSFFSALVKTMSNKKVIAFILSKNNCISDYRKLMGSTNPKEATAGSLRAKYAISIDENSVHGSDSVTSAKKEIELFYPEFK